MNRREFVLAGVGAAMAPRLVRWDGALLSVRPAPSPAQLAWQRDELALFHHFGVNTFTNREWGDGTEDPAIFNPTRFDARQWARAARSAGARAMILTAKHHDGFCLWPTKTTRHSVAASPWRGGQGDVVRDFVNAARAEGLEAGLYLSPWDRNAPVYGDSRRYNDLYCEQLRELLTNYGPIAEVWFDGANGEGPNGRKQVYDWPRFWGLVRQLQPNAVIFSDAGPDVRWIGNERGLASETNWSTVDPLVVPYPGASGDGVTEMLQHGDPNGLAWRPGETDVSIRPGWFYHQAEDAHVRELDDLVELYFTSVGRNSKLLLNVPPTPEGLLHDTDVKRLADMRTALYLDFERDLAQTATVVWNANGRRTGELSVDLGDAADISIVDLREDITRGQRVSRYVVQSERPGGGWTDVTDGTTIGYRKLERLTPPITARRLRVQVDAVDVPQPIGLSLYAPSRGSDPLDSRGEFSPSKIKRVRVT